MINFPFSPGRSGYDSLKGSVDLEVRVPLSYWQAGADFTPKDTEGRVQRLLDYRALYDGDFERFLPERDYDVMVNIFRRQAVTLTNFFMARPPEFEYEGEHPNSTRFRATLLEALHSTIIDFARFGTGLLQVREGHWGWEACAPQPVYWYPANDLEQVLVQRNGSEVSLFIDRGNGEFESHQVTGSRQLAVIGDISRKPVTTSPHKNLDPNPPSTAGWLPR